MPRQSARWDDPEDDCRKGWRGRRHHVAAMGEHLMTDPGGGDRRLRESEHATGWADDINFTRSFPGFTLLGYYILIGENEGPIARPLMADFEKLDDRLSAMSPWFGPLFDTVDDLSFRAVQDPESRLAALRVRAQNVRGAARRLPPQLALVCGLGR